MRCAISVEEEIATEPLRAFKSAPVMVAQQSNIPFRRSQCDLPVVGNVLGGASFSAATSRADYATTIGSKTRIYRSADASEKCSDSNPKVRLNASFPPTAPSKIPSIFSVTLSQEKHYEPSERQPSPSGTQRRLLPHDTAICAKHPDRKT